VSVFILFEPDIYFFYFFIFLWLSCGRLEERGTIIYNVVRMPIFELNSSSIISLYDWIIAFGIIAFPSFTNFYRKIYLAVSTPKLQPLLHLDHQTLKCDT